MKLFNGGDVRGMSWYSDFKKQQLKKGTEHELEHADTIEKFKTRGVSNRQVAEQIAKDHLEEDENYYIELDKMERKKFATGGLVTEKGGEAKVGDKGILETRNGNIAILITGITDKKVRFKIISDNNRPDSNPVERFMRNYRGPATAYMTSILVPTPVTTPTPTPVKGTTTPWTLDDFKDIKIKVDTPEKSKKLQELVLSLGVRWMEVDVPDANLQGKVNHINIPYLVINEESELYHLKSGPWDDSRRKEIFYDDIFGASQSIQQPSQKPQTKQQKFGNYILKKNVTKDDLENIKIIVDTPEKSEAFQKAAFDLGIEWSAYGKIPENKNSKYLFVRPDNDDKQSLGYTNDFTYFDKKAARQIYFDDLFELSQQTNVADELSKYRIKTKQELENEFGLD
jgi:hypothetical protein